MHTQNVNVKTATPKSPKTWEKTAKEQLDYAINEQKSLLVSLDELKRTRMMANERADLVLGTLLRMAENVLYPGVTNWNEDAPRVAFSLVQPWLQAKEVAVRLFGDVGKEAWLIAHKRIKDAFIGERFMP